MDPDYPDSSSLPFGPYSWREGTPDILEIYHARQVRAAIAGQTRRLAEVSMSPADPLVCAGELGVFYESLLMSVDQLLNTLGDVDTGGSNR